MERNHELPLRPKPAGLPSLWVVRRLQHMLDKMILSSTSSYYPSALVESDAASWPRPSAAGRLAPQASQVAAALALSNVHPRDCFKCLRTHFELGALKPDKLRNCEHLERRLRQLNRPHWIIF